MLTPRQQEALSKLNTIWRCAEGLQVKTAVLEALVRKGFATRWEMRPSYYAFNPRTDVLYRLPGTRGQQT